MNEKSGVARLLDVVVSLGAVVEVVFGSIGAVIFEPSKALEAIGTGPICVMHS